MKKRITNLCHHVCETGFENHQVIARYLDKVRHFQNEGFKISNGMLERIKQEYPDATWIDMSANLSPMRGEVDYFEYIDLKTGVYYTTGSLLPDKYKPR